MFWNDDPRKFVIEQDMNMSNVSRALNKLREKYHIQQIDVTQEHWGMASLTFHMDEHHLNRMCSELEEILDVPNVPVSIDRKKLESVFEPLPPYGDWRPFVPEPKKDDRPMIKCTKERKEKFIDMVERYCDSCFLGECDPKDDYDCRKCLERRVHWEIR